ncbi:MAG: hypothetical protein VYA34_13825 [Myxococcota bacterium]|nr:hypothetical protein [Myxococcota bacterium]
MKEFWFVGMLALAMCAACGGNESTSEGPNTDTSVSAAEDNDAVTSGGSSETLVCGASACGGDPAGTWNLESLCSVYSDVYPDPSCSGSQFEEKGVASGTLVLKKDKTYTRNLTFGTTLKINFPLSCGKSCQSLADGYDKNWPEIQCTQTATECVCEGAVMDSVDTAGSYSVTGTSLALQDTGSTEGATFEICVGSQTMVFNTPGNPAFGGMLFVPQ